MEGEPWRPCALWEGCGQESWGGNPCAPQAQFLSLPFGPT